MPVEEDNVPLKRDFVEVQERIEVKSKLAATQEQLLHANNLITRLITTSSEVQNYTPNNSFPAPSSSLSPNTNSIPYSSTIKIIETSYDSLLLHLKKHIEDSLVFDSVSDLFNITAEETEENLNLFQECHHFLITQNVYPDPFDHI